MFPSINTTLPDGTTVPSTIPEPTAMHFHSWNDDPLFRGSYANWPPAFLAEHHANLRADLQGRVWFAGEATSKLFFGEFILYQLSIQDEMFKKVAVDHLRLVVGGHTRISTRRIL